MKINKCRLVYYKKPLLKKCIKATLILFFITVFWGCPSNNEFSSNDNGNSIDYLKSIEGNWQDTRSARSLTINNTHVLFQYPNPVPPGDIVSYGNFQYVAYDGTTISILDFDKKDVTFIATKENDVLTVSGLGTIKIFDAPLDPRDYSPWNTTYTR